MNERLYIITTPEYGTQDFGPSYPDTGGPVEYSSDMWIVRADTAKEAKWACHNSPLNKYDCRDYGRHPLSGYKAELITDKMCTPAAGDPHLWAGIAFYIDTKGYDNGND